MLVTFWEPRLRRARVASAAILSMLAIFASGCSSHSASPSPPVNLEYRGLIASAMPDKGDASGASLASLGFPIPSSSDEFDALSQPQRSSLLDVLANTDCRNPPTLAPHIRVVCGTVAGVQVAVLTGAIILAGRDVSDAKAVAPSASNGTTQWSVNVTFTSAGAAAFAKHTAAHNIGGQNSPADPRSCASATVPCADYVAIIAGPSAVSIPVNESEVNAPYVQISGGFTKASAEALANGIIAGRLSR